MEIQMIAEHKDYKAGLIPGPTNLGLILKDNKVLLIDTGLDRSYGKKILKTLTDAQLTLDTIFITHAHADHFGAGAYLKEATNCNVYAPAGEENIIREPSYEPMYLYGGAQPIPQLQNRFLQAPPLKAVPIKDKIPNWEELDLVPLPGHTPFQTGIALADTLYSADAFFDPEILEKHTLPYFVNINSTFNTFKEVIQYQYVIPSHGQPTRDINNPIKSNTDKLETIFSEILLVLDKPLTTDTILSKLIKEPINTATQFFLLRSALQAYLTYLYQEEKISWHLKDNLFLWERI